MLTFSNSKLSSEFEIFYSSSTSARRLNDVIIGRYDRAILRVFLDAILLLNVPKGRRVAATLAWIPQCYVWCNWSCDPWLDPAESCKFGFSRIAHSRTPVGKTINQNRPVMRYFPCIPVIFELTWFGCVAYQVPIDIIEPVNFPWPQYDFEFAIFEFDTPRPILQQTSSFYPHNNTKHQPSYDNLMGCERCGLHFL